MNVKTIELNITSQIFMLKFVIKIKLKYPFHWKMLKHYLQNRKDFDNDDSTS